MRGKLTIVIASEAKQSRFLSPAPANPEIASSLVRRRHGYGGLVAPRNDSSAFPLSLRAETSLSTPALALNLFCELRTPDPDPNPASAPIPNFHPAVRNYLQYRKAD